jgi:hypothetical protein
MLEKALKFLMFFDLLLYSAAARQTLNLNHSADLEQNPKIFKLFIMWG